MDVNPEQPEKAFLPILVTLLGTVVFLHPAIKVFDKVSIIALHPLRESYVEFPSLIVTDVRLEQYAKAFLPILVTLLGIVTDVRLEHPKNPPSPIEITLLGMLMTVGLEQPEKA